MELLVRRHGRPEMQGQTTNMYIVCHTMTPEDNTQPDNKCTVNHVQISKPSLQ